MAKQLSALEQSQLLSTLQARFEKNMPRHKGLNWAAVQAKLEAQPDKLWSIYQMEETGGAPDLVDLGNQVMVFCDCAAESPTGRRSVCYDPAALESRKKFKPHHSALGMAAEMGITLLNEAQYKSLQQQGPFDTKTSSWVLTPDNIRKLGGALFCDFRFDTVFTYHNGAESYYAARGFRGFITI